MELLGRGGYSPVRHWLRSALYAELRLVFRVCTHCPRSGFDALVASSSQHLHSESKSGAKNSNDRKNGKYLYLKIIIV